MLRCINNFYIKLLLIVFLVFLIVYIVYRSKSCGTYRLDYDFSQFLNKDRPTLPARGGRPGSSKKHENRCREILENIFYPHLFPSVRPNFLKNPKTGRNLEIDCYNDLLRVGLEYQGVQHRKYTEWYHRSIDDFEKQVKRDLFKKKRLEKENIFMIYVPDTINYKDLEKYIRKKLKEMPPTNQIKNVMGSF